MCFGSHNPYTFWFSMKSQNRLIEINRKAFNSEQTVHWDPSLNCTMQTRGGRNQDSIVLRNKEVFACCSCLSTTVILTSTSCYGNVFPSSPLPICWYHCSLSSLALFLSCMAIWLDAAVQPPRRDYLHWRGCQNTAHNFNWSPWLPLVAGLLKHQHVHQLSTHSIYVHKATNSTLCAPLRPCDVKKAKC